jgi:murein L,D-transpeptidase YafK
MAPAGQQADLVEVFKGERRLELRRQGRTLRRYRVALGFEPEGHKRREGDGRTPEGEYTIDGRHRRTDWTVGCVAVTDREIREIWSLVPTGARIVIRP